MIETLTNFKLEDVDMIGEFLDNEARETSILLKYWSFIVTVLSTFKRLRLNVLMKKRIGARRPIFLD